MAHVKLDCGILNSTLWLDRAAREVFITALLLAQPTEVDDPTPELRTRCLEATGFVVEPGWYGFVPASGPGIVHRAGLSLEDGLAALERLAAPEPESRSQEWEGRRLVRVNGGFIVLNFMRYRDRDDNAKERMRRLRERRKRYGEQPERSPNTPERTRNVTQGRGQRAEGRGQRSDLPTGEVGSEDLTGGAREEPPPSDRPPANGSGARDEDRETMCPTDLEQRAVAVGIPAEFAKHYATTPESVVDAIREHVSYWTIGRGAGQRRAHWMRHLREHLRKLGEQKKFKPPGLVEHEANENMSESDKRALAKARAWREEQDKRNA